MNRTMKIAIICSYPLIIGLSILWSSTKIEKTLYNRYIIYNEGFILPTNSFEQSTNFYSTILDFQEVTPPRRFLGLDTRAFKLTEPQLLHLAKSEDADLSPIVIIRVRNGFKKLHAQLLDRFGKTPQELDRTTAFSQIQKGGVSTIYSGELGDQFIIRDPNGNRLLFYQKRLRLFQGSALD